MARRLVASTIILTALSFANPATAAELTGPAQAIDGATLVIAGQRIQLQGLDAPSLEQICTKDGKPWRCGEAAAFALAALIERHWLTCQTRTQAGHTAATCRMGGRKGVDIGLSMVRDGWAKTPPGSGYGQAEWTAKQAGRGLWAGP